MAAGGGCGETVEQYRAEVERLSRELSEANREKVRAAECGLAVLEENQTLKQQYAEVEAEQETLRQELEQLQEVRQTDCRPALREGTGAGFKVVQGLRWNGNQEIELILALASLLAEPLLDLMRRGAVMR